MSFLGRLIDDIDEQDDIVLDSDGCEPALPWLILFCLVFYGGLAALVCGKLT